MNFRLTSISIGLLCVGMAFAAGQAEVCPGEWHALPVACFDSNGVKVNSAVSDNLPQSSSARPSRVMGRAPQADMSLFEGRTIYGGLISSNTWTGVSITEVPYGVYSFTIGEDAQPQAMITDMIYGFKAAAWGRDNFYGIVPLSLMGAINGSRHIQIDTKNWVEKSNVMHSSEEGTYSLISCAMAYDPTDDNFYAFRYKEDLSGLDWVMVNPSTSDYEMIAAYRGKTMVLTLAPAPDGTMYYIDAEGDLYTINKETGRTLLVGNTGVSPVAYDQCMVYDNRSGSFLWAALCDEGSVLYSVDPETAEAKKVMKFNNDEQFVALYITDSEALPDAPAAVGRAQLKYSSDGALDGNITFTVPSKTFSGQNLDGKVYLDVWLDGENLKGVDVEAGSSVNLPVSLEEGNHYVSISTSNEAGWSPMRYIYQYAGYDTPMAPGNARMVFADNVNSISWDVPEGGVNKGYIDYDNLTYDVVRMPDGVKVATGLKVTSFSEPTPASLQAYHYIITAVNNGHVSADAETNRVLCGDAFPVPYGQSFEEEATFNDFFTVVDNNNDGSTWRYGYSGEIRIDYVRNQENPSDADDWLILPKISMQKGVKYRFSMLMKIFTQTYPEDFEILVGTDPEDLSSFRSVAKEVGFTRIASEFDDYTCDFLIDADADYNVAIRYCSRFDQQASLMMVRNVSVTKVGMADAPGKVTDLAITPDASDLLEATVSFKAPDVKLNDEPLSSISRIAVLRDSDETPVHVFESVVPGQELSWTDTDVPSVGIHSYTVIPSNEAGEGEAISGKEFIGIYVAPYFTDFSDKEYARTLWSTYNNFDDDPNDWSGWKWTENANGRYFNCYYYLQKNRATDVWLFSPKFRLEDNTVYTVNYKAHFFGNDASDVEWKIAYGEEPSIESMEKIEEIPADYFTHDFETVLVNRNGGRYNFGYGGSGAVKNDYFSADIYNFQLVRRTSAFAPYRMTAFASEADRSGDLKATLQFKTPETNYYNENLDASEPLTVKIYQGKDAAIPVFTTEAAPGENVKWVDEKALHGLNYYRITCENSHGVGEAILDTLFVGRDKPALIENLVVKADAENAHARLSWDKPEAGENGGLVLDSETRYNIYAYDPVSTELTPIAENIDAKTYLVEQGYGNAQQMFYYAVSAVNTEGEGTAMASSIVLGKLYDIPFEESFANAAVSTQLWQAIPMVEGATSSGLDNPTGGTYNQCSGPQDNDGGCAYFYNGYQYEALVGALLVSPKIRLDKENANELSFWAYHFKEPSDYVNKSVVYVAVSADDASAEILTSFQIGGDKEEGWIEHKVNLDDYKGSNYLSIILMGMTPGWQDVIYVDNIQVRRDASGVGSVSEDTNDSEGVIFDLNGYRLPSGAAGKGTVVVRDGKKVFLRN